MPTEHHKPFCSNCGQWQDWRTEPFRDCLNECVRRGFAKVAETFDAEDVGEAIKVLLSD